MTRLLPRRHRILGTLGYLFIGGMVSQPATMPLCAADPAPLTLPAAPVNVVAHWAGTDPSGRPVGAVLTWNAVPGATSYNIYRAARPVPQAARQTAIFHRGAPATFFIDPTASMGIDVVYFYQVTAVNSAGESPKSSVTVPGFPVADVPVVIQGTVMKVSGRTATVKTPDSGPNCPPGTACPQFIILGPTFEVDFANVLFEDAAGTPITGQKLMVGEGVIVAGRKSPAPAATGAPGRGLPTVVAQVIEVVAPRAVPPILASGIMGVAKVGPISPVSRPGQANDKPLAGATISIQPDGGGPEITRQTADASGNFRIMLPPGTYLLVPLPPQAGQTLPRGTSQTVTVAPNQVLRVVVDYDSGIR